MAEMDMIRLATPAAGPHLGYVLLLAFLDVLADAVNLSVETMERITQGLEISECGRRRPGSEEKVKSEPADESRASAGAASGRGCARVVGEKKAKEEDGYLFNWLFSDFA